MFYTGDCECDGLPFDLDDEDLQDESRTPVGVSFPLPSPLASVLMAWALGPMPDPGLEDAGFDE